MQVPDAPDNPVMELQTEAFDQEAMDINFRQADTCRVGRPFSIKMMDTIGLVVNEHHPRVMLLR